MTNAIIESIAIALHVDSGRARTILPPRTPLPPVSVPPQPVPVPISDADLELAAQRLELTAFANRVTVPARGRR